MSSTSSCRQSILSRLGPRQPIQSHHGYQPIQRHHGPCSSGVTKKKSFTQAKKPRQLASDSRGIFNEIRARILLRNHFGEGLYNKKYYRKNGDIMLETDCEYQVMNTSTRTQTRLIAEVKSSLYDTLRPEIAKQLQVRLDYFEDAIIFLVLPSEELEQDKLEQQILCFSREYPALVSNPRLFIVTRYHPIPSELVHL